MAAAVDSMRRALFDVADILRRIQGDAIAAFGFSPSECAYQITASGPFWQLRDYGGQREAPSLLIIAAPIKRPYIWDLTPKASAIRHCLEKGSHVRLLEWLPASRTTGNNGLAEYIKVMADCTTQIISSEGAAAQPFVIGHSLGGTLAAILGAVAPATIRGVVLLGAPLCFGPATSRFRDALINLVPPGLDDAEPYPGSLLTYASATASPEAFIWSRLKDAAFSITDKHALEIHARVERWALEEIPLPGRLVQQIIEWLYRDNLFLQGKLEIGGVLAGPQSSSLPTLAVVNTADDVAPADSIEPFIKAMLTKDTHIIEYPGETGVCLQHLSFLIGRKAHAELWPEIISWIESRR